MLTATLNGLMLFYCFNHYFNDIPIVTLSRVLILLYFYQLFYYRFTCRFYFKNGFQQVKAKYTDFKTKTQLTDIDVITT